MSSICDVLLAPFESDQDARLVNYPVLVTFSRRLFRCVHFTRWSRRGYASPCRRIPRPSQPPRRNAFAVRAMNWMRKFELLVQRLRRRTFDSASKERRVNTGQHDNGFAFAKLARALKCGQVRLFGTELSSSDVALGLLALPLHSVLHDGNQFNS